MRNEIVEENFVKASHIRSYAMIKNKKINNKPQTQTSVKAQTPLFRSVFMTISPFQL